MEFGMRGPARVVDVSVIPVGKEWGDALGESGKCEKNAAEHLEIIKVAGDNVA